MDLEELREEIDQVDLRILELLNQRLELVREVGEHKRENGLLVEDLEREQRLMSRVKSLSGKLDDDFVEELFKMIVKHSKQKQRE